MCSSTRIDLVIVALAVALSGCTGSIQRSDTAPVFSEVSSPGDLHSHSRTNDLSPTSNPAGAQSDQRIHVGHILLITFAGLPSGSVPLFDQRVRDDGTITLIYNRTFQAAGNRTDDLEKEIRDYYVPACFTNLAVTVRLSCCETAFVYVDGEFRNPGRYAWTNGMTLKDAIESAGGLTPFAGHRMRLSHADGTSGRYNLRGNWFTNNPTLKPGDFMMIRGDFF